MKAKRILILAMAFATLGAISCNNKEKTEASTEHEKHNQKDGTDHKLAYECPMDCEKGKTYDTEGNCPVCKMKLIEVKDDNHQEHDHSSDKHEGHNH